MTDLEKFDISKQTKPTRNALIETIGDIFSIRGKGLKDTLSYIFTTNSNTSGKKNQISKNLSRYERGLKKMRYIKK